MINLTYTFETVTPQTVYDAWLDSDRHTWMTGAEATMSAEVGEEFSAWDGYITGKNLELEPATKIVQSWRTTEFPSDAADSVLTIELASTEDGHGTLLTLTHDRLPHDQEDAYRTGWYEHYFEPMQEYFE